MSRPINFAELEVIPNSAQRIRCGPGWRLDTRWAAALSDYDLWYVWGGTGQMVTSEGTFALHPGVGVWMSPGRRYEAEQDPERPLGVTAIHFHLASRRRVLRPTDFFPPIERFEAARAGYFDAATSHIVHSHALAPDSGVAALLLKTLLLELVQATPPSAAGSSPIKDYHREKLNGVISSIRDHPEHPFRVESLARQCGYGADHFTRIFRAETGYSPKDFVVRARLDRAMALLRESSQTLGQIAESLGYADIGFFSRQFKARLGVNPSEFRQRGFLPKPPK